MPIKPPVYDIDDTDPFSPVGDETRTVGGESVSGFVREGDDIPRRRKTTLAQFLANQTANNDFPVSAKEYVEVTITDSATGTPNPVGGIQPSQQAFEHALPPYSNTGAGTGDPDAVEWLQDHLAKGRERAQKSYDGNTLLRLIVSEEPATDGGLQPNGFDGPLAANWTSRVLAHNRFTPTAPVAQSRDEQGRLAVTYQSKFGVYDPGAPTIDPDVLEKVADLLALRATGEVGAESAGYDPSSDGDASTLVPGKAQLGISRIAGSVLEARSALNDIAGGVTQTGGIKSDLQSSWLSYGQTNSYADPFSGLAPAGMVALATALILAAEISIESFSALFNVITSASSTTSTSRDSLGRYLLGKSYSLPGRDGAGVTLPLQPSVFGLTRTRHPYSQAVARGIEVFFDASLNRAVSEPGFFVTLLRTVLVSSQALVQATKSLKSSSVLGAANSVAGLVDSIRSSKLIKLMNVMALIGDQTLESDASPPDDPSRPSTVDDLPSGVPGSAATKSRDQGSVKLAWRNSAAPMSVLLPTSLRYAGAAKGLGTKLQNHADKGYADMGTLYSSRDAQTNKIPLDVMRKLETRLEAEYVPFYFHDMRTNEIVAFHAFLTQLSDSYAVNHDTTEAYGRADPIKIYRSTARSLGLGFVIAATSADDFDFMWMKLNKLVSLVYPQWSEGVVKFSGTDSFIQPFSQVPAASPLFRLRVGDVIKSNYSRFALKRIFGYGSDKFKSGDVDSSSLKSLDEQKRQQDASSIRAPEAEVGVKTDLDDIHTRSGYLLRPSPAGGYARAGVTVGSTDNLNNLDFRRVTVDRIGADGTVEVSTSDTGLTYRVTAADLVSLKDDTLPAFKSARNADSTDTGFFNPGANVGSGPSAQANTIVRSFESAMSKGLPCVISNLSFNWLEGNWETEIFGSKAPKLVRVDMSISPMHDIAPGLDAYGADRAPVYKVGQLANLMGDDDNEGEAQFERYKTALWERKS